MVILDLPALATPTGTMRVLPTCMLPKLTLGTEIDNWAGAALEIRNSEERMRIQQARPWGGPRRLMSFALFCTCSLSTAGDYWSFNFSRRIKIRARGPIHQWSHSLLPEGFVIGHERTKRSDSGTALRIGPPPGSFSSAQAGRGEGGKSHSQECSVAEQMPAVHGTKCNSGACR